MKRIISLLLVAAVVLPTASEASSFCRYKRKEQINRAVGRLLPDDCSKIDSRVSLDGNPFVYRNPDASCDLGFSFPGLPAFGMDISGLDSCQILRSVTDDLVNQINDGMQTAIDDAVDETTGGDTQYDFDLNEEITTGGGGGNKAGGNRAGNSNGSGGRSGATTAGGRFQQTGNHNKEPKK